MAHHKEIKAELSLGDTVDYPSHGSNTSVLSVTRKKDNKGDIAYRLSNANKSFNIEIYHSALAKKLNPSKPLEGAKEKRERLKGVADAFGIEYKKNIKTDKLEELIEEHKSNL